MNNMNKRFAVLISLAVASLGACQKHHDSPPPPPDTANVTGSWSGPFTYTYPVSGGIVTSVTVNGNLAMTLTQDGLGITGSYTDSTGGSGTVSGNVQNHTFTGALAFVPIGLNTTMNVIAGKMDLIVVNGGITGHGTMARLTSSTSLGIGHLD